MIASRFTRLAGSLLFALVAVACGSEEKDSSSILEPPPATPEVLSFDAGPELISAGGHTTLTWRTRDAIAIAIADGEGVPVPGVDAAAAQGSVSVQPVETTVYTLTASGAEGLEAWATVTVTVAAEPATSPTIEAFTASLAEVPFGSEVTLSWRTADATAVSLKDDAGTTIDLAGASPATGSVTVTPERSPTTYFLVAVGPGGRASASVSVGIAGRPRVAQFFVDPMVPVHAGDRVALVWDTLNTTRVVIRQNGTTFLESDLSSGRHELVLNETADFELEASGPGGTATAEAMARVGARIVAFSASERVVRANDPVTLAWELEDADGAVIDGPAGYRLPLAGAQLAFGTATINVGAAGDFVLQAFRGSVATAATLAIDVTAAPRIRTIAVDPEVVTAAADHPATVTLTWTQDGAERCTLFANNAIVVGYESFPCGAAGSATVQVVGDTTLKLVAANGEGQHALTAGVEAVSPARIVAFLPTPDRKVAPGESVELSWTVTDAASIALTKNGAALTVAPTAFDGATVDRVDLDAVYELTAVNSLNFPTRAQVAVRAGVPELLSVIARPDFVAVGSAFTLAWTADGGDRLTVEDAEGQTVFETTDAATIDAGSTTLLAPITAGVYAYTVTSTNGAGASSATVDLDVSDGPMITSFTADATEISFGETVTFTWAVSNDAYGNPPTLTLVDDYGHTYAEIGEQNQNAGSLTVTPAAEGPYVFTLTASTGGGRMESVATLAVEVTVPPFLHAFTATPDRVSTRGGTVVPEVVLAWQSENAVEVTLWDADAAGNVTPPTFHRVSLANGDSQSTLDSGTYVVHPTASSWYLARARNRVGTVVQKLIKVTVDPPEILSFTATPADVPEGGGTRLAWDTNNATAVKIVPHPVRRLGNTFVDVSTAVGATKATLPDGNEVVTINFPAGFTFPFEGAARTAIQASTEGWAGFNLTNTATNSSGYSFPTSSTYSEVNFAPYWCSLDQTYNAPLGELWSGMASDDQGDFFVVQWKDWSWYSSTYRPSNLNFELILRPSGSFEFRYGAMTAPTAARAAGEGCDIGYQGTTDTQPWGQLVPHQDPADGGLAGTGFAVDVSLPVDGTLDLTPAETTTYTLTATSSDGDATGEATVTVWNTPVISNFRQDPVAPVATRPFAIGWAVEHATSLRLLDASGAVVCSTTDAAIIAAGRCINVVVNTAGPTTYTLVAENGPVGSPYATASASLAFTVFPYLAVQSIAVAPGEFADPGEQVTLSWTSVGAVEVLIEACTPRTNSCVDVTPPGANPLAGSVTYTVNVSTEFWVRVYDVMYRVDERSASVWVGAGSLDTLTASTRQVAPGGSTTLSWTTTDADLVTISPPPVIAPSDVSVTAPFIDVSATGTALSREGTSTADGGRFVIDFPADFTFPWFGSAKTGLKASVDGWITFDMADTSTNSTNQSFPTSSTYAEVHLAPFWDNLEQVAPGAVYWKLEQPASGPRYLVVQWKNWELQPDSNSDLNFEVVLFETGDFDFRYGAMSGSGSYVDDAAGSGATIGFQSPDLTVAHKLSHNTEFTAGLTGKSWRYRPNLVAVGSATVSPTASTTYQVCATNESFYVDCQEIRVLVIQPGDVMFSELMIAPSDDEAEWFELRNMSPDAIDLAGWVLSSGSETYPIPGSTPLVVQPGGYLVFARSASAGPTPSVTYGNALTLGNTADSVSLFLSGVPVDYVAWDSTWTIPSNRSLAADPTLLARSPFSNDAFTDWCPTLATYGNGTYGGSPGAAGAGCTAP